MKGLLQDDVKITRILKYAWIIIAIIEVIIGIASLFVGKHLFLYAESVWAFGVILLVIFHGIPMMGWKNMIVVMLIGCFSSLFFEALGINYGWFFSQYTYTGVIPGPKIFGFDVFSMVAYGIACYIVWAMVQAAIGMTSNQLQKSDVIVMPILCSIVVTSIDFATDPLLATILGAYDWFEEGVYYGIPFQNYIGWYTMGFFMYLFIALYLYYQGKKERIPAQPKVANKKWFWAAPTLIYGSIWITLPFYAMIQNSYEVTVYSGQSFMTGDIYKGVACVCTGCILGPALLATARVFRSKELE